MILTKLPRAFAGRAGFTLVELLVVISLVGILAGVAIAIINPTRQRAIAEDGVRQANLNKYAMGVEAYANYYGRYPKEIKINDYKDPIDPATLSIFIKKIPYQDPTPTAIYTYEGTSSGDMFGLVVPLASDPSKCYKYHSKVGQIRECTTSVGCVTNQIKNEYACK